MNDHPPTTPISPEIDNELRSITTWTGDKPELWKAALESSEAAAPRRHRILRVAITTLATAAILLLAVGILMPALGKSRSSSRSVGQIAFEGGFAPPAATTALDGDRRDSEKKDWDAELSKLPSDITVKSGRRVTALTENDSLDGHRDADAPSRQVIRKATIELIVANTRETFAKCQHLLRADLSEFVEGSSLTGQDKDARAQLTLRVSSSGGRLDEVLNQLRTLGKVESENATGDDVTTQTVDLDASLRNERQVETEILHLLESRKDAKLQDIMELREKLASVRLGIERLQGRRDTLSRQVALASILVIIRADDAPKKDPPKPASILDRFTDETSSAWESGLAALTQTIAFIIRIAVGGLIWWLLLFAAIAIARRVIRRLIPDPAAVPTCL